MSLLGGTAHPLSGGSQSPPMTMEARVLWLLAVVLALSFTSSSGEYVGLCEYRQGGGSGWQGGNTEDPVLRVSGDLTEVTKPPR